MWQQQLLWYSEMQLHDPDQPPLQAIENHRDRAWQISTGKSLIQLGCSGNYVKLMNFEMEVMNILETSVYELTDEEKVPVIKNS